MKQKIVIGVGYNAFNNRFWIAAKVIEQVKAGARDIYIVNSDQQMAGNILDAVRDMTFTDVEYQDIAVKHNVQIHTILPEDLEELNEAKPSGIGAILINSVFNVPLRKLTQLRKDMPLFITTAPSALKGIDDLDAELQYL